MDDKVKERSLSRRRGGGIGWGNDNKEATHSQEWQRQL